MEIPRITVIFLTVASSKSDVDDSFAEPTLLNNSEPLTLRFCSALSKNQPERFEEYIRSCEQQFVADKKTLCVLVDLLEGGGERLGQKLWERFDRRLCYVTVAEDSLWIVELGGLHDAVANRINVQLEAFNALGLGFFSSRAAGSVEIYMAPDGHVKLARGPNQWMQHARLLVEVDNSQELGSFHEQKTLLGRTAKWLNSGIAVHICVLVVKLYGRVENDRSSDGMTMSLINRQGDQWIHSWGVSSDDTASVFNQFCADFWGLAAQPAPRVETTSCVDRISLKNHYPVLDLQRLYYFANLLQQEVEGGVMSCNPPSYIKTLATLKDQIGLSKAGDNAAVFTDGATIAIDGDRIYAEYQDELDDERTEQKAKRQRRNA